MHHYLNLTYMYLRIKLRVYTRDSKPIILIITNINNTPNQKLTRE